MTRISCENISFDFEKACYDLAKIYTKTCLEQAIKEGKFSTPQATISVDEMEFIAESFYGALGYFSNHTVEYVKYLVDRQ